MYRLQAQQSYSGNSSISSWFGKYRYLIQHTVVEHMSNRSDGIYATPWLNLHLTVCPNMRLLVLLTPRLCPFPYSRYQLTIQIKLVLAPPNIHTLQVVQCALIFFLIFLFFFSFARCVSNRQSFPFCPQWLLICTIILP